MDRDKETFQDNLQHEQRKGAGGPAEEIVAVLGEARQKRERKRWEIFMSLQKLFQGEILAVVIIYLLRLVREQKNRVSKVAFMESIEWIQLGSHMKFFGPRSHQPLSRVHIFNNY